MSEGQLSLFSGSHASRSVRSKHVRLTDRAARDFATDPRHNVVLEASAGTGKTSVLVERYLNLLRAGVEPANVLAITFTRQAAAEMRQRIVAQLRTDGDQTGEGKGRWLALRDRLGEISISTVDAFCLSLLREFPLEADLEPGFGLADETEVPSLVEAAVERALRVGARIARQDSGVAALLAQLGPWRARAALSHLLQRRLVVPSALHRFLAAAPQALTADGACRAACRRLADQVEGARRHLDLMVDAGPRSDPRLAMVVRDLKRLVALGDGDPAPARGSLERLREFFLTQKGTVRSSFSPGRTVTGPARRRYRESARALAPLVRDVLDGFDRDVNIVLARAVQRLFGLAVSEYQRELEARSRLDFSDVLQRAIDLLRQMDEFARSRYRLESRYHHVLVDEFQDTSRAQWELVSLLVKAWSEGSGLPDEAPVPPTIFIVGDRKQSIYRFRDADVSVLRSAAEEISTLRPEADVRRSIRHSFRAVPRLLSFVNDLFEAIGGSSECRDAFRYEADDRFPIQESETVEGAEGSPDYGSPGSPLGIVATDELEPCAALVAAEIGRLLHEGRVRAPDGSGERPVRPGDIAVLFRARESHREFDRALERYSIPTYVYKGLGFFDADEVKDVRALLRFLANPASELRAAALARSRFARLSDPALAALAGHLAHVLMGDELPAGIELADDDRSRLELLRLGLRAWLGLVDRLPPAEVLDQVLLEAAYTRELRGPHVVQARENLKKIRSVIRQLQNRGYATMARVATQLDHLSGDISTAVIEAYDAVNLMTVHAAKGLEFPVVFLVDLGRGTGTQTPAIRVVPDRGDGEPSVSVWPYRTETDADDRRRDLEETKRLLYVASTRARDRLYLSTVLSGGTATFNRGSFGEVLPEGFGAVFESRTGDVTRWTGPSGRPHEFRVLPSVAPDDAPLPALDIPDSKSRPGAGVDLRPVVDRSTVSYTSVTGAARLDAAAVSADENTARGTEMDRLIGSTVHRMLRHFLGRPVPADVLMSYATEHLNREHPLQTQVVDQLASRSSTLYESFGRHPNVRALQNQSCLFEVAFSLRHPRSTDSAASENGVEIVSGSIDCLARAQNGRLTVLEFKTGVARPEHQRQLDLYVAAARAMFPEDTVDGRLVYPEEQAKETESHCSESK